jgi:hypothetical protein
LSFFVIGLFREAMTYSSYGGTETSFLSASVWGLLAFLISFLFTLTDLLRWLKTQRAEIGL